MAKKSINNSAPKEKSKRTLRAVISIPMIIFISASVLIIAAFGAYMSYLSAIDSLTSSMSAAAGIAAEDVQNKLGRFTDLIDEIASGDEICGQDVPAESKQAIVDYKTIQNGLLDGHYLEMDGKDISTGDSFSDKDYFIAAKSGQSFVSSPYVDEATGELSMTIAAPVWTNGTKNTSIVGVLCFTLPQSMVNEVIEDIHVSANGAAYIIDQNGYFVAYKDTQRIVDKYGSVAKT